MVRIAPQSLLRPGVGAAAGHHPARLRHRGLAAPPRAATAARWLEITGEIEALASLATYAFEHPGLPFPELVPEDEGPRFEGQALAHPLLPEASRVANDVSLDRPGASGW